MSEHEENHGTITTPAKSRPFGTTVDPVEAGRKGGRAAALSRKLRRQRELEQKVLESRNGAAAVKLLEIQIRRDRALETERLSLDRDVRELTDQRFELLQLGEDTRAELDRLWDARHALYRRERR